MQLTFWWDHFEGLQCSFAFLSNVHGIYWILRRRWTVRNKCTKSKSSPEKADQRGSPLTDYSGCLSSLLSDTSLYKLLLKVILCQNKWITNFSLLPKFAKFTYISTFRLKKKGKQWQLSYLHSIASSGLMPSTSIKYLTDNKIQVNC